MSWSLILDRPFIERKLTDEEREDARIWRIKKVKSPRFEELFDKFKVEEREKIIISELMKEENKIPIGYVKVGNNIIKIKDNKNLTTYYNDI